MCPSKRMKRIMSAQYRLVWVRKWTQNGPQPRSEVYELFRMAGGRVFRGPGSLEES